MIKFEDKKICTGCTACASICPKSCIVMMPDEEGFMYPKVSLDNCIDCKLCEKICPTRRENNEPQIYRSLAAISSDITIREQSSSGGVFHDLSVFVVSRGGIVYGAAFDKEWNVIHSHADSIERLKEFYGSKYVQSSLDGVFKHVLVELNHDRLVLFSGTPCQIAGLKSFLRKDYNNLITVEVACHGVPSPKVWHSYLNWKFPDKTRLLDFSFRDKKEGWRNYLISYTTKQGPDNENLRLCSEEHSKNIYFNLFLNNLIIRPSCYSCNFKKGRSGADINIGDCWGISEISSLNDNLGVSSILVFSKKGESVIDELSIQTEKIDYERIVRFNPCLISSVPKPTNRENFWKDFHRYGFQGVKKYYKRKESVKNMVIKRLLKFKNYLAKK